MFVCRSAWLSVVPVWQGRTYVRMYARTHESITEKCDNESSALIYIRTYVRNAYVRKKWQHKLAHGGVAYRVRTRIAHPPTFPALCPGGRCVRMVQIRFMTGQAQRTVLAQIDCRGNISLPESTPRPQRSCVRTYVRPSAFGGCASAPMRTTYNVRTYVRYVRTLRTHVLAPKMIVSTAPPSTPTASSGDSEEDYGRCRCKNTYVRTHVRTDYVSTTYVRT